MRIKAPIRDTSQIYDDIVVLLKESMEEVGRINPSELYHKDEIRLKANTEYIVILKKNEEWKKHPKTLTRSKP